MFLSHYPILHIDKQTIERLETHLASIKRPKYINGPFIKLLDCYLGLTGQKLTTSTLESRNTEFIFQGFSLSLASGNLVILGEQSKKTYQRTLLRLLYSLGFDSSILDNSSLQSDINIIPPFLPEMIEYYSGWLVHGKSKSNINFLKLEWFFRKFGKEKARRLHGATRNYLVRFTSTKNSLPILNELLCFMEIHFSNVTKQDLSDPLYVDNLISKYCYTYFHERAERKQCIETLIKRWNDSIALINEVMFDTGLFALTSRKVPYVPPRRKKGSASSIKVTDEGNEVKVKLLTDVPLQLTDDQAIKFLFVDIKKDVNCILDWATSCVDIMLANFKSNGLNFDYRDLGKGAAFLRKRYKVKQRKKENLSDLAIFFGLPVSNSLEPFMYLLISEHPEITEAFILNLPLFDKFGKFVGVQKTDSKSWLVGYKRRRGAKFAEQKVCLNKRTVLLVNQIIQLTQPLRNILKQAGDDNYRYLFLSSGRAFQFPMKVSSILEPYNIDKQAVKNRINKINLYTDYPTAKVGALVSNLTLAKFRSSCALKVYLDSNSAKKMSEALGHAKFKPELLAHYLPEPILQFFESRWIKLFQKGIVCESMKDSSYLLEATQFKSMKELDEFLKNHAIKDIPVDGNFEGVSDCADDQSSVGSIYISVNEEVLTALLSLEQAVNKSDTVVTPKAIYWAEFTKKLVSEIKINSYDATLNNILSKAMRNIDSKNMGEIINA